MQVLYKNKGRYSIGNPKVPNAFVVLTDGLNDIPDEEWNAIKDHPVVAKKIKAEIIIPIVAAKSSVKAEDETVKKPGNKGKKA
jgi:hypothetical protein